LQISLDLKVYVSRREDEKRRPLSYLLLIFIRCFPPSSTAETSPKTKSWGRPRPYRAHPTFPAFSIYGYGGLQLINNPTWYFIHNTLYIGQLSMGVHSYISTTSPAELHLTYICSSAFLYESGERVRWTVESGSWQFRPIVDAESGKRKKINQ
jgi:hypothetical protein